MPKGFAQDTFEKLAELGKSTTKGSGKQIAKIINPKDLLNKALGREINEKTPQVQVEKDKSKHTPLNFDKLQSAYQDQDEMKLKTLRSRFFQKVKQEEQREIDARKQEDAEKKQTEVRVQQAKEQEKIKAQQATQAETPKGKERRSIFSHKKKAIEKHAETKPNVGKD